MRLKKKLSSCVSCTCFEGFGENEWWGAVFSVCVCVCVCVCVGRFFWVNGGSVMMPVVTSRRVIMVLALFGVDPILGNGWRI